VNSDTLSRVDQLAARIERVRTRRVGPRPPTTGANRAAAARSGAPPRETWLLSRHRSERRAGTHGASARASSPSPFRGRWQHGVRAGRAASIGKAARGPGSPDGGPRAPGSDAGRQYTSRRSGGLSALSANLRCLEAS
jgi:hypothetical protein